MKPPDQMDRIHRLIAIAKEDREVLAVALYGSVVLEQQTEESDVDVCLLLLPGPYSPRELSQKKLEYLAKVDVDVQVFQQLPIYIRQRVLKANTIVFCRDEDLLYEVAFSTIREFGSFEHIYRHYLNEVANG